MYSGGAFHLSAGGASLSSYAHGSGRTPLAFCRPLLGAGGLSKVAWRAHSDGGISLECGRAHIIIVRSWEWKNSACVLSAINGRGRFFGSGRASAFGRRILLVRGRCIICVRSGPEKPADVLQSVNGRGRFFVGG